jgi:hypothetical protein
MKKTMITIFVMLTSCIALYAQQEYTHPTTGCGTNFYYDFKGNRIAREFHCANECPCPQEPDCNCGQNGRMANKKATVLIDSLNAVGKIKLYPNPTLEKFYLEFTDNDTKAQVTVVNNTGQQISTQLVTCNRLEYNLTGLGAGIYYVIVVKNNETKKIKVVKLND